LSPITEVLIKTASDSTTCKIEHSAIEQHYWGTSRPLWEHTNMHESKRILSLVLFNTVSQIYFQNTLFQNPNYWKCEVMRIGHFSLHTEVTDRQNVLFITGLFNNALSMACVTHHQMTKIANYELKKHVEVRSHSIF
jgi:hypothetical protein